jgi:antitoxin (DNA-binding transcriptional repressor) of toxin-antitoxin stability system
VIDRAARGEQITITRDGTAVAELRALPHPPLSGPTLLERRRRLPALDPRSLRHDIDELLDPGL